VGKNSKDPDTVARERERLRAAKAALLADRQKELEDEKQRMEEQRRRAAAVRERARADREAAKFVVHGSRSYTEEEHEMLENAWVS
jgi:hypothetical protein